MPSWTFLRSLSLPSMSCPLCLWTGARWSTGMFPVSSMAQSTVPDIRIIFQCKNGASSKPCLSQNTGGTPVSEAQEKALKKQDVTEPGQF